MDFLQGYRYNSAEVNIIQEGQQLSVTVEGYWYRTILWEVPLLSLISELYYILNGSIRENDELIIETVADKVNAFKKAGAKVADFGTRRRFSFEVHDLVISTLIKEPKVFVGTSNVYLAKKYQTKPIGTHAHEWFMFHAAKYGFKMANSMALENWVYIYRGELGIALSDTFTTNEFYEIFDKKFAKLFDGVRHDSGDPLVFADKTISHYRKLGIDPLSKTIIFSDGLDSKKVFRISEYCKGKIGISFGIGTNLTNDVGLIPMNIVIKMKEAFPESQQWTDVVKLSDEPAKHTGTLKMLELAKLILNIKN